MRLRIQQFEIYFVFVVYSIFQTIQASDSKTKPVVLPVSQVKWEKLNPARGDKSPQAGILWGNLKDEVATGFLAKFIDGFASPPHLHNVTYRAVVINGYIHNDDPKAEKMWMPGGSFWTQPKGEVHITAAKGSKNIALVEIDKGPYLVLPPEKAFDSGEKPINVDYSNIVWTDFPYQFKSGEIVKVAYLWGSHQSGESNGTFLKIPSGFNGKIKSYGTIFRAVIIKGQIEYNSKKKITLNPGSYFGSPENSINFISSHKKIECIIYIRTNGKYEITKSKG